MLLKGNRMNTKTIMLLCGGGESEHEISLKSSMYIEENLKNIPNVEYIKVEIKKNGWYCPNGDKVFFDLDGNLNMTTSKLKIDYVIPCIHGYPGETGDIQSLLKMSNTPYLGCNSESSKICFNKVTTKLWFDALGIKNTPYIFLQDQSEDALLKASNFLFEHEEVFVKAASQGSSIGCYKVDNIGELLESIKKAFTYSNVVLIEKCLKVRELEVAAYEMQDQLQVSFPGEIIAPQNSHYTFEEKYSASSQSVTHVKASNLTALQIETIDILSRKAFKFLNLKDLSRIDFFLTEDGEIYLNEINTFPGMTEISMFPKMLIENGHSFQEYLKDKIDAE